MPLALGRALEHTAAPSRGSHGGSHGELWGLTLLNTELPGKFLFLSEQQESVLFLLSLLLLLLLFFFNT